MRSIVSLGVVVVLTGGVGQARGAEPERSEAALNAAPRSRGMQGVGGAMIVLGSTLAVSSAIVAGTMPEDRMFYDFMIDMSAAYGVVGALTVAGGIAMVVVGSRPAQPKPRAMPAISSSLNGVTASWRF